MPRGVRNMNTLNGIDSKIESLTRKKQTLLEEMEQLDNEIEALTAKRESLAKEELLDLIVKSGKSIGEVKESLGL